MTGKLKNYDDEFNAAYRKLAWNNAIEKAALRLDEISGDKHKSNEIRKLKK